MDENCNIQVKVSSSNHTNIFDAVKLFMDDHLFTEKSDQNTDKFEGPVTKKKSCDMETDTPVLDKFRQQR